MPLTLSGTNGVSGIDGSAGTPTERGSDADTGVFYPSAGSIAISTNSTEALRVNSSQQVGIGTTSPAYKLDVSGDSIIGRFNGSSTAFFDFAVAGTTNGRFGTNGFATNDFFCGTTGATPIVFATNNAERARIDSSGNLLVGTTSVLGSALSTFVSTSRPQMSFRSSGATAGKYWRIWADDNNSFSIYNNNSAGTWMSDGGTSWNSSSDEQLKDIIAPISDALDKISTLRSVTFKWKNGYNDAVNVGLIAQDVQAVLPEAVSEAPDGYLGLSYTSVIPLLVAAIKELSAKNDALEARIAALEAN